MNNFLSLLDTLVGNLALEKELFNTTNNLEKMDFTKKEDLDKLDDAIKSIKEYGLDFIFSNDLLDKLYQKAHQIYDESHKEAKKLPTQPSKIVSEKIKNQITNLAVEYVNKMILPNLDGMDSKKYKNLVDSLTDFGCWIYNK